jgi:hypothetical protein
LFNGSIGTYVQDNIFDEQNRGCGKLSPATDPLAGNIVIWSW